MELFSTLLESARREKEWSLRRLQRELVEAHDRKVSYSFLGAIEKGRRVPSYDLACTLASVFEIEVRRALHATFNSRMQQDQQREVKNIEETIKKWRIADLSSDEVISGQNRDAS